jgi:hypothetical protein
LNGYVKSTFHYPAVVDVNTGELKSDAVVKVNLGEEKCKWRWDRVKTDYVFALYEKVNRDRFQVELV